MATSNLNVVVKLVDQLTGPAKQMAKAIADIEKMVSRSSNSNAFGGVVRGAQRAITQIDAIGKAAEKASGRIQSLSAQISVLGNHQLSGATSGLRQIGSAVSQLTKQYQALQSQMSRTVSAPRMPPPPRQYNPHVPYNQSGGLNGAIGGGVGGYGVTSGAGYIGRQAGDLNKSAIKQQLAGLSAGEMAKIRAASWELTQRYKNFSASMIQDGILEMRSVYGSTDQAIGGIEAGLKAATVLKSQLKGKVDTDRIIEEMFSMLKAADLRNVTDSPAETVAFVNNMTKAITATGGRLTPKKDFVQLLKQGKTGAQYWTDDFITRAASSMMQEGGPDKVGTALTSMYQNVISGRIGTKDSKIWTDLGLVDPTKIVRNKAGDTKGIMPGGVSGGELFRQNPYEWTQQVLGPALLKKLGYAPGTTMKGMSDSDFDAFAMKANPLLSGMFGNRNSDWIANTLLKYRPIERDRANTDKATGLEGAAIIQNNDLFTAWDSFTTQMNNVLAALASPLVGPATTALNAIAEGAAKLASALAANPDVAAIAGTAVAVAAGLIAIGAAIRSVSIALAISKFALGAIGIGGATGAVLGTGATIGTGVAAGGLLSKIPKLARIGGGIGLGLAAWDIGNWLVDGNADAGKRQPETNKRTEGIASAQKLQSQLESLKQLLPMVQQIGGMPADKVGTPLVQGRIDQVRQQLEAVRALTSQVGSQQNLVGMPKATVDQANLIIQQIDGIMEQLPASGQQSGAKLMENTAAGMAANSGAVIGQAEAIKGQIQSVFSTGITIPLNVSPSGIPSTGGVDPGVSKTLKSGATTTGGGVTKSASVGNINVYAAPGMDARQVAEAVDSRFREAVKGQLNDGVFA